MTDLLTNIAGWCCPTVIHDGETFRRMLSGPTFDADGYQRAERIHGIAQCPDCGLWWPLIEQVEAWRHGRGKYRGKHLAIEWGPGTAECLECGVVLVDSFDGCFVIRP